MITRLPDNLPALLRAAGLTVVEVDGWRGRSRPGAFAPVGVLNHHTGASALGWAVAKITSYIQWIFLVGRPDLSAPLCQLVLWRDGTVYIGAAGRANHAGTARAAGSVAAGDGNTLYVGIEWMISGTEKIPKVMYDAGVLLNAVLLKDVLHTSPATVAAHFETSVTGKWDIGDPAGVSFLNHKVLDMNAFRKRVTARLAVLAKPKIVTPVSRARDLLAAALENQKPRSKRAKKISEALNTLPTR